MDSSSPCLEVITFKYRDIRQEVPHRYSRDSGLNMPKWSRLFPSQRGRGFSGARQAEPLAPITPTIFLRVVSNIITDNSLQSTSFDSTRCQSTGLRVSLIHQTHTSYQPFGESRRSRSGQVVCRTIARPLGSSTFDIHRSWHCIDWLDDCFTPLHSAHLVLSYPFVHLQNG